MNTVEAGNHLRSLHSIKAGVYHDLSLNLGSHDFKSIARVTEVLALVIFITSVFYKAEVQEISQTDL